MKEIVCSTEECFESVTKELKKQGYILAGEDWWGSHPCDNIKKVLEIEAKDVVKVKSVSHYGPRVLSHTLYYVLPPAKVTELFVYVVCGPDGYALETIIKRTIAENGEVKEERIYR